MKVNRELRAPSTVVALLMWLPASLAPTISGCDDDGGGQDAEPEDNSEKKDSKIDEAPEPIRFEAEDATLDGVSTSRTIAGYSGTGYVTGFEEEAGSVAFEIEADSGVYALSIGFATPYGTKGFEMEVNGVGGNGQFEDVGERFAVHEAGTFKLDEGKSTVVIGGGWGYYVIDYIEIAMTEIGRPEQPEKTLTDPEPMEESLSLMSFLVDNFGKRVLSGQQNLPDIEYVETVTGRAPAVGVFDLIDYSPSRIEHGANPAGSTEQWIEWADEGGGIVGMGWHWNAPTELVDTEENPWWRGFYADATTFDIEEALADPEGEYYALLLRDMDAIAVELRKLEAAGLPVLWRPLHEASGGWFWWGARGSEPYIELWRLMWNRLVGHQGLHNLIWVYTLGDEDWYPGDEYVDVVSCDVYADPSASMSGQWEEAKARHVGVKLIALSEASNAPDPDHIRELGIWWSWFSVWSGQVIRSVDPEHLASVYDDRDILTLDELPAWWLYPSE